MAASKTLGDSDKETVRFVACGSVDDGKSTLIGRLLYDNRSVFDDQVEMLKAASDRYGSAGESLDFALLLDGLEAEREQGITIDVAYRFFATARRRFIVADAPGHEQYTRNMATAASTANLAVILIDARKGVLVQTRRHSRIVAMMGIRQVVVAVTKMDMVDYDERRFAGIVRDYESFASALGVSELHAIPVSGLVGDNIIASSERTPWYRGPTLLACLESMDIASSRRNAAFRMPIQMSNRPDVNFRGSSGRIASGEARPGDEVCVVPGGATTTIKSIIAGFGEVEMAAAGDAVTIALADEINASRGQVLASRKSPPECADQFEARLLWLDEHAMTPGRQYLLKLATAEVSATVAELKYVEDVDTGAHLAVRTLAMNEIGRVTLWTAAPVAFAPYEVDRTLGGFILVDKMTFATVGAGMIEFALRRAQNIHWQALEIGPETRAAQKHQKAQCVWLTGLSGAGKSTIANLLDKRLNAEGRHTYLLDGDNVRHGLNRDLGFTEVDRVENIRRVAEVARLMLDAGLIVIVSFISPFRAERRMARELFPAGAFKEVFIDTPLEECERRDTKGLYAKARRGELKNFTGIDSPYEPPEAPEAHVRAHNVDPQICVEQIHRILE